MIYPDLNQIFTSLIGLALAREILDITGITIKESGEPGNGARFEMTVPKAAFHLPKSDKNREYGIALSRSVT